MEGKSFFFFFAWDYFSSFIFLWTLSLGGYSSSSNQQPPTARTKPPACPIFSTPLLTPRPAPLPTG